MRPRGENVHYDDLLDRHEIVVAAKRKLDAQVVTLAAELANARIETAHHSRVSAGLQMRAEMAEDRIRALEAKLRRVLALEGAVDGDTLDEIGRLLVSVAETPAEQNFAVIRETLDRMDERETGTES